MAKGRAGKAGWPGRIRAAIPFRAVNRKGTNGYDAGLQRHHLFPRQLLSRSCFGRMFDSLGYKRVGFDDFRANGLLLPANENNALRTGMPLHRGPHREYNDLVIHRVGTIEEQWTQDCERDPQTAMEDALFRLALLQSALRQRLLDERRRMVLNRKDPLGTGFDFSELDAMAAELWKAT